MKPRQMSPHRSMTACGHLYTEPCSRVIRHDVVHSTASMLCIKRCCMQNMRSSTPEVASHLTESRPWLCWFSLPRSLPQPQVQNLVAPRLLHAVKHAWNPLSRRQSAAVASVHRDLLVYLQPTDPLLQARRSRGSP